MPCMTEYILNAPIHIRLIVLEQDVLHRSLTVVTEQKRMWSKLLSLQAAEFELFIYEIFNSYLSALYSLKLQWNHPNGWKRDGKVVKFLVP